MNFPQNRDNISLHRLSSTEHYISISENYFKHCIFTLFAAQCSLEQKMLGWFHMKKNCLFVYFIKLKSVVPTAEISSSERATIKLLLTREYIELKALSRVYKYTVACGKVIDIKIKCCFAVILIIQSKVCLQFFFYDFSSIKLKA